MDFIDRNRTPPSRRNACARYSVDDRIAGLLSGRTPQHVFGINAGADYADIMAKTLQLMQEFVPATNRAARRALKLLVEIQDLHGDSTKIHAASNASRNTMYQRVRCDVAHDGAIGTNFRTCPYSH